MKCFYRGGWILPLAMITAQLAGCSNSGGQGLAPMPIEQPAVRKAWTFAGVDGWSFTTAHYRVFTTTASAVLRNGMPGFMEACRANYLSLTGLETLEGGQEKLLTYVFGSRREWAALTEKITGPAAEIYLKVENGGYCFRGVCVFWDIGVLPTYGVAAHEGMHQFLHHATRQSLPIWAEEGLATQAEGYRIRDGLVYFAPEENVLRFRALRTALMANRWRPAQRLISMGAADNIQESRMRGTEYYGQLWALMLMIRQDERYANGLRRLLRDAADGRLHEALGIAPQQWRRLRGRGYTTIVGPKTFAHYIDADMDRFERRYEAFAKELVRIK